jgi:hypothetical protein
MKTIQRTLAYLAVVAVGFSACTSKDAKTTDAVAVKDQLTYEVAKRYVMNYERHAGVVDGSTIGPKGEAKTGDPNTRAVWFSAGRLDSLVATIKKEGGDGVRFYFATYDKIGSVSQAKDKPHLGYNTLVMVSTYKDGTYKGDVIHRDYYTNKPGQNGVKGGFIIGNPPENRGEMCPPPRACDSVGATLIIPETK